MSSLGSFRKQPADKFDFDINYSLWLTDGDGIAKVDVTVSPADLLLPNTIVSSPRVKVWAAGGRSGITYKITLTATTDDDRVKQDEFTIKVKDT